MGQVTVGNGGDRKIFTMGESRETQESVKRKIRKKMGVQT